MGLTLQALEAAPLHPHGGAAELGPNHAAVRAFLAACEPLPWRRNDGDPLPFGFAGRLATEEQALNPMASRTWVEAMFAAGFRSEGGFLENVWQVASPVGEAIGGHHARLFLCSCAGELAQPERDLHFFLDLLPFAWAGRWPCGWDDEMGIPLLR
jgi:hypothetical protein